MTTIFSKRFSLLLLMSFIIGISFTACKGGKKAQNTSDKVEDKSADKGRDIIEEEEEVTLNADAVIGSEVGKWGPDSLKTVEQYSLYREYYKQKVYDDAIGFWRYVYKNAPEARKTPYVDGVKMYTHFAENAADEATKMAYVDTIKAIYDQRVEIFGEEGFVTGKLALLNAKFNKEDKETYYALATKSVDIQQEDAAYYLLTPYYASKIKQYNAKELSCDQMEEVYAMLLRIAEHNIENHQNEKIVTKFEETRDKLESTNDKVESACAPKGPAPDTCADCVCTKEKYDAKLAANPSDLKTIKRYLSKLQKYQCKTDPKYAQLLNQLYSLEPTAARARRIAQSFYKSGDINNAIKYYLEAAEMETDRTNKSKIYMNLATIERRKVSDLTTSVATQARKYAKQAAELNPSWGKPYMFIGDLYASSGPLCGSGTGWKSQRVAWAACDMWEKARDIDPSVAATAKKNINRYSQFFPLKSEGFMRGVSQGDAVKIGCWMGTSTRARFRAD